MKKNQIHEDNTYKATVDSEDYLIRIKPGFEFVTKYDWDDTSQKVYIDGDSYEVVVLDDEEQSVVTAADYNKIRHTLLKASDWDYAVAAEIAQRYDTSGISRYRSNTSYISAENLGRIHINQIKERLVVTDHYIGKAAKAAKAAAEEIRTANRRGWNTEILEEIVNPTIVAAFEAVPESFVAATDTHRVVEQTRTGDNLRWTWGVDIDTEDEDVPVVEIGRHGDTTRIEVGMATFLAMANAWQQTYGDQSAEDIIAEFGVTFPALPPVPENAR